MEEKEGDLWCRVRLPCNVEFLHSMPTHDAADDQTHLPPLVAGDQTANHPQVSRRSIDITV